MPFGRESAADAGATEALFPARQHVTIVDVVRDTAFEGGDHRPGRPSHALAKLAALPGEAPCKEQETEEARRQRLISRIPPAWPSAWQARFTTFLGVGVQKVSDWRRKYTVGAPNRRDPRSRLDFSENLQDLLPVVSPAAHSSTSI